MKRNHLYLFVIALSFFFTSCIKNEGVVFKDKLYVEFDATVLNTPLTGQLYPVLTRVPTYGAAVSPANPSITRASGTIKFRVNLVGAQQSTDQVIKFKAVSGATIPTTAAQADAGTHYSITGNVTIPANKSFGEVEITVINPGVSSTTPRAFVIELEGNGTVLPSENYKRLGIQIAQN